MSLPVRLLLLAAVVLAGGCASLSPQQRERAEGIVFSNVKDVKKK